MRVVKVAVEKGMELLGYTLILIGGLELLRERVEVKQGGSEMARYEGEIT